MRKLVENENKTLLEDKTMEIYEWEDDDWMSYEKNVVQMQNNLADLDVVKVII